MKDFIVTEQPSRIDGLGTRVSLHKNCLSTRSARSNAEDDACSAIPTPNTAISTAKPRHSATSGLRPLADNAQETLRDFCVSLPYHIKVNQGQRTVTCLQQHSCGVSNDVHPEHCLFSSAHVVVSYDSPQLFRYRTVPSPQSPDRPEYPSVFKNLCRAE